MTLRPLLLASMFLGMPSLAAAAEPMTSCAAWHCSDAPSAPLAWTRAGGGDRGFDVLSTGDLCPRHAAKAPYALTMRFALVFGFLPAMLGGYATFRIFYVVDRFGPGLPRFTGERWAKPVLFGIPLLVSLAWVTRFLVRAW